MNLEDFLDEVAQCMGMKVVTWADVNDVIDKNISFGKLVDIDKYFTEEEKNMLRQRNFIGGIRDNK